MLKQILKTISNGKKIYELEKENAVLKRHKTDFEKAYNDQIKINTEQLLITKKLVLIIDCYESAVQCCCSLSTQTNIFALQQKIYFNGVREELKKCHEINYHHTDVGQNPQ